MRKFALTILALFIGIIISTSQVCNPNAGCSSPSCPDSTVIMTAVVGKSFTQTITLNIPSTYTDPTYGPITIDSTSIDSIKNLPPGISWGTECGMTTPCMYMPGQHCLLLTGTPTTAGTYTLSSYSTGYLTVQTYSLSTTKVLVSHYVISVSAPVCNSNASCTAPSCPDSTVVMTALVNNSFTQTITLNIPSTYTDPTYGPITIDSTSIDSIKNLPPGISWGTECGMTTPCMYMPGQHCLLLTGTPTTAGTYTLSSYSTGYLTVQTYSLSTTKVLVSHYVISVSDKPTITTSVATSITTVSAISGGTVTNNGNATLTDEGIYYDTNPITIPPGGSSTKLSAGVTSTPFNINLSGLSPNTVYYVLAYATNTVGTAYGSSISFTTTATSFNTLAAINTTTVSSITSNSSFSGGNVTSDGGATVTARGLVYSTSPNPTLATGTNIQDANGGTGTFISSLIGLSANTLYYVVAYATNTVGVSYGNQVTFTTLPLGPVPILSSTTTTVTTVNSTIANVSGGGVTNNGGSSISSSGIVYSTSSNPTLGSGSTVIANNSGNTSTVTAKLTGLTPGTIYYIRTYATNANGTGYGNVVTYATPAALSCTPDPSVTLATQGISPDKVFNLDTSNLNFSQTFTYSLPTTYTDAQGNILNVDSSFLYNIVNLPSGLVVHCGRTSRAPSSNGGPNCIFYPGEISCFTISGTLPNINNQLYKFQFVLKDYGVINVPGSIGDQALQTYYSQGFNEDTIVIKVVSNVAAGIQVLTGNKFGIIQSTPNPFSDIATIKYTIPEGGNVDFYVTDIYGREVYKTSVNALAGINTINYSADNISAGSYYFTISYGTQKSSKLMILIR